MVDSRKGELFGSVSYPLVNSPVSRGQFQTLSHTAQVKLTGPLKNTKPCMCRRDFQVSGDDSVGGREEMVGRTVIRMHFIHVQNY